MTIDPVEMVLARLAACGLLHEAIVAGLALTPPWLVVDVVVQDELTHDLVMMAGAGGAGPALVLDCTWLGRIDAVSVWDHRPDADELLAARVAAGWAPTPTATRDGNVVMGHACKLPAPATRR